MKNAMMVLVLAGCGSVDKSDTVVDDSCEPGTCGVYCEQRGLGQGVCGLQDESCTCVGGGDADTDADADSDSDSDSDTATEPTCGYGTADQDCDGASDGTCSGPEADDPAAPDGVDGATFTVYAHVKDPDVWCDADLRNFHVYADGYDTWWNAGSADCPVLAPPPDYVYTRSFGPWLPGCYEVVVVAEGREGQPLMVGVAFVSLEPGDDDAVDLDLVLCADLPDGCPAY